MIVDPVVPSINEPGKMLPVFCASIAPSTRQLDSTRIVIFASTILFLPSSGDFGLPRIEHLTEKVTNIENSKRSWQKALVRAIFHTTRGSRLIQHNMTQRVLSPEFVSVRSR